MIAIREKLELSSWRCRAHTLEHPNLHCWIVWYLFLNKQGDKRAPCSIKSVYNVCLMVGGGAAAADFTAGRAAEVCSSAAVTRQGCWPMATTAATPCHHLPGVCHHGCSGDGWQCSSCRWLLLGCTEAAGKSRPQPCSSLLRPDQSRSCLLPGLCLTLLLHPKLEINFSYKHPVRKG